VLPLFAFHGEARVDSCGVSISYTRWCYSITVG